MLITMFRNSAIRALIFATTFGSATISTADRIQEQNVSPIDRQSILHTSNKQSWAVAFDNDIFVPGGRDQDYTYGINVTFTGKDTRNHRLALHQPLSIVDRVLGISSAQRSVKSHKIEYGLFGFTPEDITVAEPNANDRPYASLLYVSSTNEHYLPHEEVSWHTTLTVGALGLGTVGDLQEFVHDITDGDKPAGWDNQISDGGEMTARLNVARQSLLAETNSMQLKSTLQGSVGYISEASWSLSLRTGNIHSPWLSFNPELTVYGENSAPAANAKVLEQYFWAGISVKGRAYNAFLQGQFRDSEVEFASDDLNHGIVEAWMGYTVALVNGYRLTYSLRGHTSEIKEGPADRNVLWGGIQMAKSFG